jgi:hypothetical protein
MHQVRIEPSILPFGQHPGALFVHDHLLLPVTTNPLPSKVSDLWVQGTQSWDLQMLSTTFSLPRPLKQSLPFSPLLVTAKISFVGHPQRLVSALLRTSTTTYLYNSRSIYLYMVPGVFSLEPTIFCSVCGKVRTYLLSSKRSPGGS